MIKEALTAPARVGFSHRPHLNDSAEALNKTRVAVELAKQGDKEALRFLYVSYSDNVYGYVRTIVRDDHEAEDVTQHVFAKLMTALERYDDRGVPFFAWLLRLAHNAAIDDLRTNRLTPSEFVIDPQVSSELDMERSVCFRDALETLPEEQREVVVLRHVIGLTPREIAKRLGRSEGSVNGLHHRGRRALQHELREGGSAPCTRLVSA
jgi:RNA polymerase sigma-70 factor, ECF subfamily